VREEKMLILTGKSLARLQNSWESLMESEVTLDVDKKSIPICSTHYFLFRGVHIRKPVEDVAKLGFLITEVSAC
jgi:hypothetical protein